MIELLLKIEKILFNVLQEHFWLGVFWLFTLAIMVYVGFLIIGGILL